MAIKAKPAIEGTTGTIGAGNTMAPYDVYADFLINHGFWIMSYADWLKVIGGIYCLLLILKMIGTFKALRWVFNKLRAKL